MKSEEKYMNKMTSFTEIQEYQKELNTNSETNE